LNEYLPGIKQHVRVGLKTLQYKFAGDNPTM